MCARKVKDESSTGSSTTSKVTTVLCLTVEQIEYDTSACQLRVKGRNIQENRYVKVMRKRGRYRGREGKKERKKKGLLKG